MKLDSEGTRWYVLRTKPKSEERADNYLHQHGIETFLPWIETPRYISGTQNKLLTPLFPGYLFARFDLMESYTLVRWGKGVNTILGFGDHHSRGESLLGQGKMPFA